jgi:ribosomal protein L22
LLGRPAIQTRPLSQTRPRLADSKDPDAEAKAQEADRLRKDNPLLAQWYESKDQSTQPTAKTADGTAATSSAQEKPSSPILQKTSGAQTIFDVDDAATQTRTGEPPKFADRDPEVMSNIFDPTPESRIAWEQRMVRQAVKRRGRLTKDELIARTERQSLTKSHWLQTSVKKLGPLARQIAGKPIEDAILQMRFSKKKAAREVKTLLELARDEAVVRRGMGLGKAEGRTGTPIEIELKDGSKTKIADRTGIYIDQAWVGRGSYKKEPEFRARGRVNMLRHPHTSKVPLDS